MENLLSKDDLKIWLHRKLSRRDKLLLVLATCDKPCQVKDIRSRAKEAGFQVPTTWNPSASLRNSQGLAIRVQEGWEITDVGRQHLRNLGVTKVSPAAVCVATELRAELLHIRNDEIRSFVEEAIKCYEAELYRSAIVMSWIGAVAILQRDLYT